MTARTRSTKIEMQKLCSDIIAALTSKTKPSTTTPPLSRTDIAAAIGNTAPKKLPLAKMCDAGTIIMHGNKRGAKYSLVVKAVAAE